MLTRPPPPASISPTVVFIGWRQEGFFLTYFCCPLASTFSMYKLFLYFFTNTASPLYYKYEVVHTIHSELIIITIINVTMKNEHLEPCK